MPQRTNALWFFFALIGGGACVLWSKNTFANAWFSAIIAAGVVLALAIYYMLNDQDAPEEEGDNVYYLGLLFTLISLMFTLVELFGVDVDTVRSAEKIRTLLQNFGIALSSTVVGIVGRVMVQNWQRRESKESPKFRNNSFPQTLPPMGTNPESLEKFDRYLLGRIARDLTHGANALARFHRIVQKHASDTDDHLRKHSEELKQESTKFKDELQRNVETFTQELNDQAEKKLDTVANSFETVAKQAEILMEQLNSVQREFINEVRETTRTYQNEIRSTSSQSLEALQQNYGVAAGQSLSLAQNMSATYERIGKTLERLESNLEHASIASSEFGKNTDQAAQMTAALRSDAEKLRNSLEMVHNGAKEINKTLETVAELNTQIRTGRDAEQTAVVVQQIGESLRNIAKEGADATAQAAKSAGLFDTLTQNIATTEKEVIRVAETLNVLANEAEKRTKELRGRKRSNRKFWKSWR